MKQHRLAKGQRIVMAEREYIIEQSIPGGDLQLKDVAINTCVTRSESELIDLLFKGHLKLLNGENEQAYAQKKMRALLESDLTEFPDEQRAVVRKKHNYVTGIIKMGADRKTRKVFEPLIETIARSLNDENPPSYWQVYRWYTDYFAAGEIPRAFFPRIEIKGNKERKIQKEVVEITDKVITEKYLDKQRLTQHAVFEAIVAEIKHENDLRAMAGNPERLKYPDETTVHRIICKLDPYEVAKARYGQRYADMKFKPKKEGVRPTRILERVEFDHTKLDLLVVDFERRMPIGRPWLTLAIDVFSKCIVGMYISFVPPSYLTVMQCLLHGISSKSYVREKYPNIKHTWDAYGIMETAVTDNGKEFHSADFEDACLQLGIAIQYAPVKYSWYKPSVERFFGTLNTDLLHQQPGTTFSNIFEKDEYDSKKNAVISYEAFEAMVHKWIIDIYHQNKHKGLMNTPAEVWKAGVQECKPALPESRKELEVMLGMVERRTITSSGIELHNLLYNDDNLLAIRRRYRNGVKEKVKVKYDPTDLSMIYVQDEFKKNYVPVRAISQDYTQGLNLWAHRVICRYARERLKLNFDITSLVLAKEEICKMAMAEWALTKRTGSRQKIARFFNLGKDDYGKVIEPKQGKPALALLPESQVLTSEPVLPSAADHTANGISDIGSALDDGVIRHKGNTTGSEFDAELTGNIVDGGFASRQPKKRQKRLKGKRNSGSASVHNTAERAGAAPITRNGTVEPPDLSGWGVSYVKLSSGGKHVER